ncbi:MAG: glycosyl transferase family 2, partial [Bacteroidota bacterium]
TVFLAAIYGFLPLSLRSSRALIILGLLWSLVSTISLRTGLHFLRFGNLQVGREQMRNLVIVGSMSESERVTQLLHKAQVHQNIIGTVSPHVAEENINYLGALYQLSEIVHIYKVDELIFCSQDVTAQQIMQWMTALGTGLDYKIVPAESLSIIGSSSKNTSGQLYTIDIQFNIARTDSQRNKRIFDIGTSVLLLILSPILWLAWGGRWVANSINVLLGQRTWVGYEPISDATVNTHLTPVLPTIRRGVFYPSSALQTSGLDAATIQRLNFLYAKDYNVWRDWTVLWQVIFRPCK